MSLRMTTLVVLIALLAPIPASALPRDMVETIFYSDPAFTDQVGWQVSVRCNGSTGPVWGEVGAYWVQVKSSCREQTTQVLGCMFGEYVLTSQGWVANWSFPVTCPPHIWSTWGA